MKIGRSEAGLNVSIRSLSLLRSHHFAPVLCDGPRILSDDMRVDTGSLGAAGVARRDGLGSVAHRSG